MDLNDYFNSIVKVQKLTSDSKKSPLTVDPSTVHSFFSKFKRSLFDGVKIVTYNELVDQVQRFYINKFSVKKDLLYDMHYEAVLQEILKSVDLYKLTFEDHTHERIVCY